MKRSLIAFGAACMSVWLVVLLPQISDKHLYAATVPTASVTVTVGTANSIPVTPTALTVPSDMLVTDLDLGAAKQYQTLDGLVSIKVPSGWNLPTPQIVNGTAQPNYNFYDFTLSPLSDRASTHPENTSFLATIRIQLTAPEAITRYVVPGKPPTLHNALEGFAAAMTGYGNFGAIIDTPIGKSALNGVCLAMSRDAIGGFPATEGQICAAAVSDKLIVLVTYGAQQRLASLLTPVVFAMLDTLSILSDTLPTPTPVPSTPTWTPAP